MSAKTKLASFGLAAVLAVGALTPLTATAKAGGYHNNGYVGYTSSERHRDRRFDRGHNYDRYVGRRDHRRNGFGVLRRLRHAYRDMRRGHSVRRHVNNYRFNGYNGQRHGYNYRRHSY